MKEYKEKIISLGGNRKLINACKKIIYRHLIQKGRGMVMAMKNFRWQ